MKQLIITKNNNNDLEIISANLNQEDDQTWLAGEIKNISQIKLGYVGVVVAQKNFEGQVIDCAQEYILGNQELEIGGVGYFKYFITTQINQISEIVVTPYGQ